MDSLAIAKLVATLLLAIHDLSDYPVPAQPPTVEFVAHEVLEREACGGPCAIFGWFPGGRTIYLDQGLDPLRDPGDRSILLHELVHYLQQESGAYAGRMDCRSWSEREREAFDIQIRWLTAERIRLTVLRRYGRMPVRYTCDDRALAP